MLEQRSERTNLEHPQQGSLPAAPLGVLRELAATVFQAAEQAAGAVFEAATQVADAFDPAARGRRVESALAGLPRSQQTRLRALLTGDGDPQLVAGLRTLLAEPQLYLLPDTSLRHLLGMAADWAGSERSAGSLRWVLRAPGLLRLSAAQQRQIFGLIDRGDFLMAEGIAALVNRRMPDGSPALLAADRAGTTVLDHLTHLSSMELAPGISRGDRLFRRSRLNYDLVRELGSPVSMLDQGARGACAAASAQYLLVLTDPAEYLRLLRGLLSPGGRAQMRGGRLEVVTDSLGRDNSGRSTTERIFQSALLQFGSILDYSNSGDTQALRIGSFRLPLGGGLRPGFGEMSTMLNGLFGEGSFDRFAGAGVAQVTRLQSAGGPAPVCINWGGGLHALICTGVRDGWVYLWDPNGSSSGRNPIHEAGSYRGSNIRMPASEFQRQVRYCYLPHSSE